MTGHHIKYMYVRIKVHVHVMDMGLPWYTRTWVYVHVMDMDLPWYMHAPVIPHGMCNLKASVLRVTTIAMTAAKRGNMVVNFACCVIFYVGLSTQKV